MKTLWQRIYGFFGFWSYTYFVRDKVYQVFYWCYWPWKFHRKYDIFRIDITKWEAKRRAKLRQQLQQRMFK